MTRPIALLAAAAILAVPAAAARSTAPDLVRATSGPKHHVVVVARFADGATPRLVEVSRAPHLLGTFGFPSMGLVLRESIDATPSATGMLRLVTHARVPAGRFWVAVSSDDVGMTSCVPLRPRGSSDCLAEWSNVVPLTVK